MSEMDLHESAATDPSPNGSGPLDTAALDPEAPVADAVEQHTELREHDDRLPTAAPYDVEPADLLEQERVVDLDEDDYR